jgi:trk system potassium uptake protein TrkH
MVLVDLLEHFKNRVSGGPRRRLSLHSRLALVVTGIVVGLSTVAVLFAEPWAPSSTLSDRILTSLFQTVSASTTDGFNTIDIGAMAPMSLFVLILLMFIGASPGSTGGGVKTTTVGVIVCWLAGHLRGDYRAQLFRREIPIASVQKAFAVVSWFAAILVADVLVLTVTEKAGFLQILFESASALGNTGLSMGITGSLSDVARIVLSLTMFVGRVGPLAITRSVAGRVRAPLFQYAQADVQIG